MTRTTLVSESSISTAFLLETIHEEEFLISISTENVLVIQESITQEVRINMFTILSNLINSHVVVWLESRKLITFEEIEQELQRVVLLNSPGYYSPIGLPTNYPFYNYVYSSLINSLGHRLMGIFNKAKQAHPTINWEQSCLGLL